MLFLTANTRLFQLQTTACELFYDTLKIGYSQTYLLSGNSQTNMYELYRLFDHARTHYRQHHEQQWNEILAKIQARVYANITTALVVLLAVTVWNFFINPVQLSSLGIVTVALGATRLALTSAHTHMRKFFESCKSAQAVSESMPEYRVRVAGMMVDAFSGFVFVAVGFMIRVAAELT
jgi:hypothetical protein